VAASCEVNPTPENAGFGVTAMASRVAAVTFNVMLAEMVSDVAVMTVEPTVTV
jgi:hypothetical protein